MREDQIDGQGRHVKGLDDLPLARRVNELSDWMICSFNATTGAEMGPYRKSRLREGQVRVFGFTESVRQFTAASDLLVTKAGGVTLAEAMAAQLPMVSFGSLPGQEARNERFATRAGMALLARSEAELLETIVRPFDAPGVLRGLRDKIRRVRKLRAAEVVVDLLLGRPARITEVAS